MMMRMILTDDAVDDDESNEMMTLGKNEVIVR